MRKMIAEIKYSLTMFSRNTGGMFWTFGFPIMLFVILGFMYAPQAADAAGARNMLEFMLPGIIGMSIMSASMNSTVAINVKNRARGIFRKLATTPVSRIEWNASKIVTQTIITLLSVGISVVFAGLVFGLHPNVDIIAIVLVITGTITFVGLGLIFASLLKSEESATSAANMVTFPLMFLSGSFFPVDKMPWFFKWVADVSPLTYLNNGLRETMVSGNTGDAVVNLIIVAAIGAIFFIVGVAALKWKED
jgi:ABC-2 type transport system permease protein